MRKLTAACIMAVILSSCHESRHIDRIGIDIATADTVFIEPGKIVSLETSDSSMIYDINSLALTDSIYIVHSRDYLRAYSRDRGRFVGDIARKGAEPENFGFIGNIWLSGDTVFVFDPNKACIFSYLADGQYAGRKDFTGEYGDGEKPRQYFEMPGTGVFTCNFSTDHTTPVNPKYSFYSDVQGKSAGVPGRELKEPTTLADGTFADIEKRRLLSWEPLRDTIFSLTEQGIEPLYHVDFGANALPSVVQGLPYILDRATVFNSAGEKPYASLIRYVQRKDDTLYFAFACSDSKNFIVSFDEKTGATKIHHFKTEDGKFSQTTFFKIEGDSAFIEILDRTDELSNPCIYSTHLNTLK